MLNTTSKYLNDGRLEIEGSFDLSNAAAVQSITDGRDTKTCRGQGMSVVKANTGLYTVTVKTGSSLGGGPPLQPVELLSANANLFGTTLATALFARVSAVTTDTSGDILITVNTMNAAGANTDTTGAITVQFSCVMATTRMGTPI